MRKVIINNRGFTLIEAVASLVLITIILLSFIQIFVQTNATAATNNDKLVAINLAEAELERIKLTPFDSGYLPAINPTTKYDEILTVEKELYTGGDKYTLKIEAKQNDEEFSKKLINVVVTVIYKNKKSIVEGYIRYE